MAMNSLMYTGPASESATQMFQTQEAVGLAARQFSR